LRTTTRPKKLPWTSADVPLGNLEKRAAKLVIPANAGIQRL